MDILLNYGADVNHVNDEGLNALNLCILQHISEDHEIDNWEHAFLYHKQTTEQGNHHFTKQVQSKICSILYFEP